MIRMETWRMYRIIELLDTDTIVIIFRYLLFVFDATVAAEFNYEYFSTNREHTLSDHSGVKTWQWDCHDRNDRLVTGLSLPSSFPEKRLLRNMSAERLSTCVHWEATAKNEPEWYLHGHPWVYRKWQISRTVRQCLSLQRGNQLMRQYRHKWPRGCEIKQGEAESCFHCTRGTRGWAHVDGDPRLQYVNTDHFHEAKNRVNTETTTSRRAMSVLNSTGALRTSSKTWL